MDGRESLAVMRRPMQGSGSAMSMSPPADTVGSRLRAGRARRAPLGATIGGRRHHTASQVAGCPGVDTPARSSAICATGEPATCPSGRFWRRRRCGVPYLSSATVSPAPSPIERTRRQSVLRRQASSGQAGLKPAVTSLRHSSSTGAYPCTMMPSASQRSEPMSSARITACGICCWRLISENDVLPKLVSF